MNFDHVESPSMRHLLLGVKGLVEGGHPNVPAVLRMIASSVEAGEGIIITERKEDRCGKR